MSFLGDEARRLRDSGMPVSEIQSRLGVTKHALTSWLARRPLAKDELRAQAVELRIEGWSVNDIALELSVARSTAWRWVEHLPLDPSTERARQKAEHSKLMTDARWARHRVERDEARSLIFAQAAQSVGDLTDRDLLLLGAAVYWCEGTKSKPWRRSERITFVNSDPMLIELFLRFLAVCEVPGAAIGYRVSIHETANVESVTQWWSERLGLPISAFRRPTIKRHQPRTVRRNVGATYRGCLVVEVRRGREVYWRIEGLMAALAAS